MSVASRNPFSALLGQDDGDNSDSELPKVSRPVQVDTAPPKGGAPTTGRNAPKSLSSNGNANERRSVPGQNGGRSRNQGGETTAAADAPAGFEGERSRDDRGAIARGGGARGGRGGSGRGGDRERRRGTGERRGAAPGGPPRLDRRSATGKTDSEKQEHQGWGGDEGKRELEAENAGVTDAAAEQVDGAATAPATPATPAATDAPAAASEEPAEPEDNSLTYEEYLQKQKAAGRGALESLNRLSSRPANEGQDDAQWKDAVLVEKDQKVDEAYFAGSTKEEKAAKQKERKQKTFLETEFTSPAVRGSDRGSDRGRGGRGRGEGRGAPRGMAGRGRGAGRGARGGAARAPNGSQGVNVDDSAAFPSLS